MLAKVCINTRPALGCRFFFNKRLTMHLILTGATGLIGSAVLQYIIRYAIPAGEVTEVSILSRRPVFLAEGHDRIHVIHHTDFGTYPESVLQRLRGAHSCIWSIGVSQNAVPAEDYINITVNYAVAAAEAFSSLSQSFNFIYVSSDGATQNAGIFTPPFKHVKGQAEAALLALAKQPKHSSLRVLSVRPGGVDPRDDETILDVFRNHRSRGYSAVTERVLFPVYTTLFPHGITPASKLGVFLTKLAMGDGEPLEGDDLEAGGRVVPNRALLRLFKNI